MKLRKLNDYIDELTKKSIKMRNQAIDIKTKESDKLREKQDEVYKKRLFMINLYKASKNIKHND